MLNLPTWAKRLLFALLATSSGLLVASGVDIAELDKVTALCGGLVGLLSSLFGLFSKN